MESVVNIKKLLIAALTIFSVGQADASLPFVQQFSTANKTFRVSCTEKAIIYRRIDAGACATKCATFQSCTKEYKSDLSGPYYDTLIDCSVDLQQQTLNTTFLTPDASIITGSRAIPTTFLGECHYDAPTGQGNGG